MDPKRSQSYIRPEEKLLGCIYIYGLARDGNGVFRVTVEMKFGFQTGGLLQII